MKTLYFPMDTLRVTQGYGVGVKSYSHAGSYALDLGGADGRLDWMTAPCDLMVRRIYGSYNAVWFETVEKLEALGATVVLLCLHMNTADKLALGLHVGKIIRAGQRMYREGTAGNVTGAHIHFEVGCGPFAGNGWHKNAQGVWRINEQLVPHTVLTLQKDCRVLADGGYPWKKEEDTHMMQFYEVFGEKNCQAFDAPNVEAVSADLANGKLPAACYPLLADIGDGADGYHWYRILAAGKERYAVLLADRSRLTDLSAGDAVPAVLAQAPARADTKTIYALRAQLERETARAASAESAAAVSKAAAATAEKTASAALQRIRKAQEALAGA